MWQNPNIFTSFSPNFFLTIFLVKSKLSTAKTTTFSRVFHPKFFLTTFLVKSKLYTAKKSKTTTFSRVFHPEKSTTFSGNQSWIFGQKMKISNSVLRWVGADLGDFEVNRDYRLTSKMIKFWSTGGWFQLFLTVFLYWSHLTLKAASKASRCLLSDDFFNIKNMAPDILRLLFIIRIYRSKVCFSRLAGKSSGTAIEEIGLFWWFWWCRVDVVNLSAIRL